MKLPETRKERIQLFILIGLGSIFVIAGFVVGVVNPLLAKRKARHENIARLKHDLASAKAHVDQMMKDRVVNSNIVAEVESADTYVLHSRLGNFLLGASETIDEAARRVGVDVDSVEESGISALPVPKGAKDERALKIYTARVKLTAGLHGLLRLILELETANPYLTVSSIEITQQPSSPDAHGIVFSVQWPIWDTSDEAPAIAKRLRETKEELVKRVIVPYDSTTGLRPLTGANAPSNTDKTGEAEVNAPSVNYPDNVQLPQLPGNLPMPGQ